MRRMPVALTRLDGKTMSLFLLFTRAPAKLLGVALLTVLAAGCAQQQAPGYYTVDHDSTSADARKQAMGNKGSQAPSQIQMGFGSTTSKQSQTTAEGAPSKTTAQLRPLAEPKTFLGTVPCLGQTSACDASRLTLTLAPNGPWRARTEFLNKTGSSTAMTQQGCWSLAGTHPLRIVLVAQDGTTVASLSFVNDNVLRINRINDTAPTLDYHLTRQADLDPINDMADNTTPQCNN